MTDDEFPIFNFPGFYDL